MICEPCRQAAAIITGVAPPCPGRARELHELECKGGTWCDCKHQMPRGYRGCGSPDCAEGGCTVNG